MIIDGPITFDLTLGQDRRVPQEGDAQTDVPPVINPVVLALRPTRLLTQPANPTLTDSTLFDFFISRVNQVALTSTLVTLAKGLWELEMSVASIFDFNPVPPLTNASPVELSLTNSLVTTVIGSRFPAIGSFTDYNRLRILLLEPTAINLFVPLTGVTDDLSVQVSLNCIRII